MIIDWTSYLNQWQSVQGQYVSDAISTPQTTFVDTYMSYISASEWLLTVVDGESVSRLKSDSITLLVPVTINDTLIVNGKIGVNITPLRALHSYHATDNITGLFESGDATVFITMADSDSTSNNHVRVGAVGDDLVLWAGQLERARISSGGGVTIYNTLDVAGKLTTGAGRVEKVNPLTKTANYTILDTDHNTWNDTSGGAFWNKLPSSPNIGEVHNVYLDVAGNTLTVDGNGRNIMNFGSGLQATVDMNVVGSMGLIYNGNHWMRR